MEFITVCSSELENFSHGKIIIYHEKVYYSLERVTKLIDVVKKIDEISDLAIIPYYFFGEQIMELYDYTLSVRVVNSVRAKELFFLEETGKQSIADIDKKILEKLDITYHEVAYGDKLAFQCALSQYTNFMSEVQGTLLEEMREELNLKSEVDAVYYQII